VIKRALDLAGALIGLILLSPLLVIIAIVVRLDSQGPILYRGLRIGRGGQRFEMLKFRTMQLGAETALEELIRGAPDEVLTAQGFQKLLHDPRLTRAGRFLRRSSFDELPQLWNVLVGEMSLVGPRPFLPEQRKMYGEPYADYIRVRPGMTGLWQVSGRSRLSFTERARIDADYLRNWSLRLDLRILVRTIWVVVNGDGAY
jgi:lipopolysaccharide/colanic/teichoic acid biosynthesis glycosyltransferase